MKTRDKILRSGWELFSEKGFEAVSVRDVTNHAKVNLASVSYHFGSKAGLIQEIVAAAVVPLNRQRVLLLKQAGDEAGGVEKVLLPKMIEAFVRPVIDPEEYGGSSDMVARLIARYLIDEDYAVPESVLNSFTDVYKIFGIAIRAQCPNMSAREAHKKLIFSTGSIFMYQTFSWLATKTTGEEYKNDKKDYLETAIKFCVAGFDC